MIKSITNISDFSVIEQNGVNDILSLSSIEFEDNALDSGGFGSVHKVVSIDGKVNQEFVLKVFADEVNQDHAFDVVKLLHDKLKRRQYRSKLPSYHEFPELLGLPFIVFKGLDNISEKNCVAFLMYDLNKVGYKDYGSDTTDLVAYNQIEITDKLYLAYQLAKTIDFLHEIKFIHADISENSLWFDTKRIQLSIIDYDSGYHYDRQGKPTTIGKIGHWISSRFRNIIGQKKDTSDLTTLDRLYEEYWVLANAVFEIVFGVMPFFFLSDSDDSTKKSYLKENQWPFIDYSSNFFNSANQSQHQTVLRAMQQLEDAGAKVLIDAFKKVFNKGYKNDNQRLSSSDWKSVLSELNQGVENIPTIKKFNADKYSIKEIDEQVVFSFDAQKYSSVLLDGNLIPVSNNGVISIPLKDSKDILLQLENDFGRVNEVISIEAIRVEPEILSFNTSNSLRNSLNPIELTWTVSNVREVEISNVEAKFVGSGSVLVEPMAKTKYSLSAIGYFNQKVSKDIIVDVISPQIKSFTWEVNLEHGIDNVDLKWETQDAQSVEISPSIKETGVNGIAHVPLSEKTTFNLLAKGYFNSAEMEITAHPFPVPVVKQIFAEAPRVEINSIIQSESIEVPQMLKETNSINFTNNIQVGEMGLPSNELINTLKLPEVENHNYLIKKYSKERITISDVYQKVLEKILNRLSK